MNSYSITLDTRYTRYAGSCFDSVLLLFWIGFRPLSSDKQHLSYGVCLEVRGEIIRTVLCRIVHNHKHT